MNHSIRTKFKFTLLELLIVISIMIVLMSLLLPSLRNAKFIAKKTTCTGNLKQIGCGALMYVADYNSVPCGFDNASGTIQPLISYWGWPLRLQDYIKSPAIMYCPVEDSHGWYATYAKQAHFPITSSQMYYYTTYFYKCAILRYSYNNNVPIPLEMLSSPTRKVLFFEASAAHDRKANGWFAYNSGLGLPHIELNAVWADGHVEVWKDIMWPDNDYDPNWYHYGVNNDIKNGWDRL